MISAALPTKTPSIEMPEMKLMALTDFLEKRYRLAIYTEVFMKGAKILFIECHSVPT
jgi:hypothetical protein